MHTFELSQRKECCSVNNDGARLHYTGLPWTKAYFYFRRYFTWRLGQQPMHMTDLLLLSRYVLLQLKLYYG